MPATVKCPTCEKPVEWSEKSPYRPFCCERCRLIDLGAWAGEQHRIPTDTLADFPESAPYKESFNNDS